MQKILIVSLKTLIVIGIIIVGLLIFGIGEVVKIVDDVINPEYVLVWEYELYMDNGRPDWNYWAGPYDKSCSVSGDIDISNVTFLIENCFEPTIDNRWGDIKWTSNNLPDGYLCYEYQFSPSEYCWYSYRLSNVRLEKK